MIRSTLLCIARDEVRDIEEWVRFHRGIGFDRVVLYDHLSTDGTAAVASRAGAEVVAWELALSWQISAYNDALKRFAADTEWIAVLDSDEFLVPVADGSVPAMLDRFAPYDAIAVPWRCYGSAGLLDFPDEPVTRAFTMRAPDDHSANRHTKPILRASKIKQFINPHFARLEPGLDYVEPGGDAVDWMKPGKSKVVIDASIARINHYQTRSRAHYEEKVNRVSDKGVPREDRWSEVDRNDVDDPIIPMDFGDIPIRE